MELQEALQERHSVRDYTDQPIDPAAVRRLEEEIAACDRPAVCISSWPLTSRRPSPGSCPTTENSGE